MNIAVIIGFGLGLVLIVFCMAFDAASFSLDFSVAARFVNLSGAMLPVFGTLAVLIMSFPLKQTLILLKSNWKIILGFDTQINDPVYYINVMTELSAEARQKGMLALEEQADQLDDAFLRGSVMLLTDALDPEQVRDRLNSELDKIETRHASCWEFYDKGAAVAPGMGLAGTLIGLIHMLGGMTFDEAGGAFQIASGMAGALLSTFYGVLMANLFFIPLASQLRAAHNREMVCKEIIIEGILSIQAGENPRHVNEKLLAFLTLNQRAAAVPAQEE